PPHRRVHPGRSALRYRRCRRWYREADPQGVAHQAAAQGGRHRRSGRYHRPAQRHHRAGRSGSHPSRSPDRGPPHRRELVELRAAGYRLFGSGFDYILHLRPAEWPIMAAHTSLGYFLAVGVTGALSGVALPMALAGIAIWVVLLNGGTLAINSAFDRDEGDI